MVTKLVQVHDMSYSLFSMVMEVQDFLKALSPILIHIGLVENYSKFEENGSSCFFFHRTMIVEERVVNGYPTWRIIPPSK